MNLLIGVDSVHQKSPTLTRLSMPGVSLGTGGLRVVSAGSGGVDKQWGGCIFKCEFLKGIFWLVVEV